MAFKKSTYRLSHCLIFEFVGLSNVTNSAGKYFIFALKPVAKRFHFSCLNKSEFLILLCSLLLPVWLQWHVNIFRSASLGTSAATVIFQMGNLCAITSPE